MIERIGDGTENITKMKDRTGEGTETKESGRKGTAKLKK
jgi:hypothetical protein